MQKTFKTCGNGEAVLRKQNENVCPKNTLRWIVKFVFHNLVRMDENRERERERESETL